MFKLGIRAGKVSLHTNPLDPAMPRFSCLRHSGSDTSNCNGSTQLDIRIRYYRISTTVKQNKLLILGIHATGGYTGLGHAKCNGSTPLQCNGPYV